jgi:hypothetical protein
MELTQVKAKDLMLTLIEKLRTVKGIKKNGLLLKLMDSL